METIIFLAVFFIGLKIYYVNNIMQVNSTMDMLYVNALCHKWKSIQKYIVLDTTIILFYVLLAFGYFAPILLVLALLDYLFARNFLRFKDDNINSYDDFLNKAQKEINNKEVFDKLSERSNFFFLYRHELALFVVVMMELRLSTPFY